MARYVVERTFPNGLEIPADESGAKACLGVVDMNQAVDVTWVHSYVTEDHRKTYCIYDGPNPEAIRRAAEHNGLPIDSITQVSVLDPYFYRSRPKPGSTDSSAAAA
jgi:Protein of unknown function (DUF4242)